MAGPGEFATAGKSDWISQAALPGLGFLIGSQAVLRDVLARRPLAVTIVLRSWEKGGKQLLQWSAGLVVEKPLCCSLRSC